MFLIGKDLVFVSEASLLSHWRQSEENTTADESVKLRLSHNFMKYNDNDPGDITNILIIVFYDLRGPEWSLILQVLCFVLNCR
jgi:hypothetical protein